MDVDQFIKMVAFAARKTTIDVWKVAEVLRYHRLPDSIISDWDVKLMSIFWKAVWIRLGTTLNYSTTCHLQMDGETEAINRSYANII